MGAFACPVRNVRSSLVAGSAHRNSSTATLGLEEADETLRALRRRWADAARLPLQAAEPTQVLVQMGGRVGVGSPHMGRRVEGMALSGLLTGLLTW